MIGFPVKGEFMEKYQMKKQYFVPLFMIMFCSVLMLVVFAFPYSRYRLASGNGADDLSYYIPLICTIGEIVLFSVLVALCILELFTSKLFVYRLEISFDLFFLLFAYVLEILFVSFYKVSDYPEGMPYYLPLIFFSLFFLLLVICAVFTVYLPFHNIEKESKEIQKRWERMEKEEEEKRKSDIQQEVSEIDSKAKMQEYLKSKYESGELSKEKYIEFLNDLDTNSTKEEV